MSTSYMPPDAGVPVEEEDEQDLVGPSPGPGGRGDGTGEVNPLHRAHAALDVEMQGSVGADAGSADAGKGSCLPLAGASARAWLLGAWGLIGTVLFLTMVLAGAALVTDTANAGEVDARDTAEHKAYKAASASVGQLETTDAQLQSTNAQLHSRLNGFVTEANALNTKINTVGSAAAGLLASDTASLAASVSDLESTLTAKQTALDQTSAAVATLQSDVACPPDAGVLPADGPPVEFNGHYYQWVPAPYHYTENEFDVGLLWKDAERDAASRCHLGLRGYLATITSQAEQDVITDLVPPLAYSNYYFIGWLGAADRADEGTWTWTDGPDKDLQFWSGNGDTGQAVNGAYNNWYCHLNSNWDYCEPNNANNQDCMHAYGDGSWNDIKCSVRGTGYFVEYGT